MKNISILILNVLFLVLLIKPITVCSQTSEFSWRTSVNLEKKVIKNLKFELEPEVRFDSNFEPTSFIIQPGLNYNLTSWLNLAAYYRLKVDMLQEAESLNSSSAEYSNRFAFDANTKFEIYNFNTKFRLRYCNFTDFDDQTDDKSNYFRYKLSTEYKIKSINLTPFASAEFYHKMKSGLISKTRYSLGLEYELNKPNAISISYSFDDKYSTLTNYHIFELTYKFKF